MKTQLLAAAVVTTLVAASSTHASDLSYLYSTLRSTSKTSPPQAQPRRPIQSARATSVRPARPSDSPLLLGAYLTDVADGLQVAGTVPGSSARANLKPGDVIRRVTAPGLAVYKLDTMNQLNYAKRDVGPNRPAALEVVRPGAGVSYVWVTFRPANEFAQINDAQQAEARSLFD